MNRVRMVMLAIASIVTLLSAGVAKAGGGNEGTAVGIQFGYPGNVGLSLRLDNIAVGASWHLGDEGYLHTSIDYWILHNRISKEVNWYLGPGLNLGIGDPFMLGVRLPVGLQWLPTKNLEIFGEFAPSLWLIEATDFDINAAVGIRYVL